MSKNSSATLVIPERRTKFFASAPNNDEPEHIGTFLNVPTVNKQGKTVVELIDIDTYNQVAEKQLLYTDFEITRLLASGVKIHPINITPDNRLGVTDEMIEDYNRRLESIADQMFNVEQIEN